jgi:flagellar hook-associated protein 2
LAGAGALRGDLIIREMQRRFQRFLQCSQLDGQLQDAGEVGVNTNRDGTLSLTAPALSRPGGDPLGVEALFTTRQTRQQPAGRDHERAGKVKSGTYTLTDLVRATASIPPPAIRWICRQLGTPDSGLRAPFGSPAAGLSVLLKGAVASATVTVEPGLGGALQEIRDYLRAQLALSPKSQQRLAAEAKAIAADKAALEQRAKTRYDQLTATFVAMERQVSSFKRPRATSISKSRFGLRRHD